MDLNCIKQEIKDEIIVDINNKDNNNKEVNQQIFDKQIKTEDQISDNQVIGNSGQNSNQNNSIQINTNRLRRGRKNRRIGGKVDMRAKLERSRQSARECRARKKLRYQYLEDLVIKREMANIALKQELKVILSGTGVSKKSTELLN